jgi:hypothetical protein
MRLRFLLACVVAVAAASTTAGGVQVSLPKGGNPDAPLEIVEVIGCVSEGPFNTWVLTRSTEPVVTNSNSLSAEAVKLAESKALGVKEHRLLVVSEFDPWAHIGHKVVIRGILSKSGAEARINVTGLRRLSFSCTK